jgi:type IV secretory pathway TrbL component
MAKKVTVAKGVKVARGKEEKMQKKPGSSNAGEYKKVKPSEFAGAAGGASKYSYPINTKARAKAALAYAHNAPNPAGIRRAVHKKYPGLGKKK